MKHPKNINIRLRLLSYAVICYMLIGFSWWIVLLITKNDDAFSAKTQLLKIGLIAEGKVKNDQEFQKTPAFLTLKKDYVKQKWMIVGEAVVLTISLLLGFWLINRGYHKEVMASNQRRNFLLSITHELKSPLASIRLVLETILKRSLKKEQVEKLGTSALKETDRLNKLVNDLLLSAKLESAYEPNRQEIDINQLLEEVVDQSRTKYPNSFFELTLKNKEASYYGDQTGIRSVILNLLENGVKYSFGEAQMEISCANQTEGIQIQIKDQGIGISDKDKKKIFDKFYRIGNEDTRKTKGTGLGLFIVDQIVKAHNGSVRVKDNQPSGTKFEIYLPHLN